MSSARHEPKIVDAHHHRWDRQLHSYPWLAKPAVPGIAGDTTPLCRNYLVADFQADIGDLEVVRSMHIQAEIAHDLSLVETRWLQAAADAGRGFPHGIVAYADLSHRWTMESIRPFVLETIEIFDVERCLFASNSPVDKLFGDYRSLWSAYDEITRKFSVGERSALFHDNALRVYRL
jgi:predicted TIM-barrel fold metal-dependent hydrolase